MKEVTQTISLYSLNELSENSRLKAINDELKCIAEVTSFDDLKDLKESNLYKAYAKCISNQTAWFLLDFIWEYCSEEILQQLNEYYFYKDGTFYDYKENID